MNSLFVRISFVQDFVQELHNYFLFARAGSIPRPLAWFGVLSSALLVVAIPLEGVQIITGALAFYIWLPSLLFELMFAPWLLINGVTA